MKILFIGDSIVKGTQGVDWVRMIARKHPEWTVENAGINGETFNRISDRLLLKLSEERYDVVVLEGGYNDILLPAFEKKHGWFNKAYHHQLKAGNKPSTPQEFEFLLKQAVDYIKNISKAKVILTTIGCINEWALAASNEQTEIYNAIIRKVASEFGCQLADPARVFLKYLVKRNTTDYMLENFISSAFLDAINCIIGRADHLSHSRGLHLTIDGVHLNTKGALVFKEQVEGLLINFDEKVPLYI